MDNMGDLFILIVGLCFIMLVTLQLGEVARDERLYKDGDIKCPLLINGKCSREGFGADLRGEKLIII